MFVPGADPVGATSTKLTWQPLLTVAHEESGPDAATNAIAVSWLMPTPVGPVHPTHSGTVCGLLIPFSSTTVASLLALFVTTASPSRGKTATPIGPCPTESGFCGSVAPVVRSIRDTVPSPL